MKAYRAAKRTTERSAGYVSIFRRRPQKSSLRVHKEEDATGSNSLPAIDLMSMSGSEGSFSSLFDGLTDSELRSSTTNASSSSLSSLLNQIRADTQLAIRSIRNFATTATSRTSSMPGMLIVAAASFTTAFLLYEAPIIIVYCFLAALLHKIGTICLRWAEYTKDDPDRRRAFGAIKHFLRRIINESEKAVSGDYARLVMAGYILYNCTAPGESYLSYVIRYKMSMLNHQVIDEIQEWGERKLGYERSETKRNLFQ